MQTSAPPPQIITIASPSQVRRIVVMASARCPPSIRSADLSSSSPFSPRLETGLGLNECSSVAGILGVGEMGRQDQGAAGTDVVADVADSLDL